MKRFAIAVNIKKESKTKQAIFTVSAENEKAAIKKAEGFAKNKKGFEIINSQINGCFDA